MADEDRTVSTAPFSNDVVQVLHMHRDREGSATAAALKGLNHVPPLTQFPSEWRNLPGRRGSTVQCDQ
jgi:hypothetical protein